MNISADGDAADGHHDLVAQPHHDDEEGPVAAAEAAAATLSTEAAPLGRPGRPMDHRSPFFVGMAAAAGVAVTALGLELILTARQTLVLIGLALFIAVGLEPAVSRLARRGVPRPVAVAGVVLALLGAVGGFLAVAIPQLVAQATAFAVQVPAYLQDLQDRNTALGAFNQRFGVIDLLRNTFSGGSGGGVVSGGVVNGVLGAGVVVLGVLADTIIVVVLSVYFLADLPRIRRGLYRLTPHTRLPPRARPRRLLDRADHPVVLAEVAEIGQHDVIVIDPAIEVVEQTGQGADAGHVVLAAGENRDVHAPDSS